MQPRTPTRLKVLRGNPGKRKLPREMNPARPETLPDPPEFLMRAAKDEWWRVADELYRLGVLTLVDTKSLAAYCQAYARWELAEQSIARMAVNDAMTGALMIRNAAGGPQPNPLVKMANQAARDMVRYAGEFGLTPVARARIAAAYNGGDDGGSRKFAGLLAG